MELRGETTILEPSPPNKQKTETKTRRYRRLRCNGPSLQIPENGGVLVNFTELQPSSGTKGSFGWC